MPHIAYNGKRIESGVAIICAVRRMQTSTCAVVIAILVPDFCNMIGENGATIAAVACMIASGIAPASAPAKAVKGKRAVEQSPLATHSRVKRVTRGFGIFGGCLVMRRRTEAAPTEDAAESLRRLATTAGTFIGAFDFLHGHSFLYIVFTGI